MGKHYKQLTKQDRIFIDLMLNKCLSKAKIARLVKVHVSTIYREIKRNSVKYWWEADYHYVSNAAQKAALRRRKRGLIKLEKDEALRQYVHEKLEKGWSPYQIEGRLKRDHSGKCLVSHESIYRYIYADRARQYLLSKYLRRKHRYRVKKGQKRSRFPDQLRIENRPASINNRDEFGHWECDLMIFKRGVKGNLITLRERKSRYLIAIKNENKKAESTAMLIIKVMSKIKQHVKSVTFDRGNEFAKYEWIQNCMDADIYFCDPASPHQKGAIENGNSVLRLIYPRSQDIRQTKQKDLNKSVLEINDRPMRCLSYQTPREIFNEFAGIIE